MSTIVRAKTRIIRTPYLANVRYNQAQRLTNHRRVSTSNGGPMTMAHWTFVMDPAFYKQNWHARHEAFNGNLIIDINHVTGRLFGGKKVKEVPFALCMSDLRSDVPLPVYGLQVPCVGTGNTIIDITFSIGGGPINIQLETSNKENSYVLKLPKGEKRVTMEWKSGRVDRKVARSDLIILDNNGKVVKFVLDTMVGTKAVRGDVVGDNDTIFIRQRSK
jgi:hypothetical protein